MKRFYIFIFFIASAIQLFAQEKKRPTSNADTVHAISGTPSGSTLTYSTLTQFVQSNVTTGSNGGFNFKTSVFGLKYLFSGTKQDSLSGYYLDHTTGRNTEIGFGVNKASKTSDQLSTITLGLKWAAINNRDKTIHNFAKEADSLQVGIRKIDVVLLSVNIIYTTRVIINKIITDNISDPSHAKTLRSEALAVQKEKIKNGGTSNWTNDDIAALLAKVNGDAATLSKMKVEYAKLVKIVETNHDAFIDDAKKNPSIDSVYAAIGDSVFKKKYTYSYALAFKDLQTQYNNYAKKIDLGALLTFSLNPGYNIQHKHPDTTSLAVRFLKGLGSNYKKPWNVDLQGTAVSLQDSSASPKNFAHNKLKFTAGINKIFAMDDQDNPLLESEFAGEYDVVISGKYTHEKKHLVTLNLVTNIHLSKEFTLPLTLKYDVKNPSLFGFLSIQWNLQDSGKSSSKK